MLVNVQTTMMTRFVLATILVCSSMQMYAQFGFRIFYAQNDLPRWQEILSNVGNPKETDILNNSLEVAMDYWIPMNNVRVEWYVSNP